MARSVLADTLRLPSQEAGKPSVDLNLKALTDWRESLPLANLQESTRRVFMLLRETNRLALNDKQRSLLLDQLHIPINYVSDGLSKLAKRHSSPLPEKVIRLVRINEGLLAEAAIGYKSLLATSIRKRSLFINRERQLCDALQAVLHYLARIVLEAYSSYVPFPDDIWGEIHDVYRLAEKLNITHLKSEDFSDGGRITIADDYKRLLLLALASPYHLERSDIDLLYSQLAEWSSAVKFKSPGTAGENKLQIVVRIEADAPPCFQVMESQGGGDQSALHSRLVDTSGLISILDRELERWQNGAHTKRPADKGFKPEALIMLRESWSGPTTRGELRYQGAMGVRVAVGLNAVHYYLGRGDVKVTDEVVPATGGDEPAEELELSIDGEASEYGSTITDARRDSIAELLLPKETAASWTQMRAQDVPMHYTCKTLDFSTSGCQLVFSGGAAVSFNMGDILSLGFFEESDEGNWKVGVIRWLREGKQDEIYIGVRILASSARSVIASISDESGYVGDQSGCLLLADPEGTTLVTPRMPYTTDNLVRYQDAGEQHYIRLGENLETSSRFARFRFRPLTEEEMAPIHAERDRPIAEPALPSRLGESSVEELLEDRTAWDNMPRDW